MTEPIPLIPDGEQALLAKGWVRNRRGRLVPGPSPALQLTYQQLIDQMNQSSPGWQDRIYNEIATNYRIDPIANDHVLAYAVARQQLGMDHEGAKRVARLLLDKNPVETVSRGVQPEKVSDRLFAVLPLSSEIPARQAAAVAPQAATPRAVRMTSDGAANERERLLGLIVMMANERGPAAVDTGSSTQQRPPAPPSSESAAPPPPPQVGAPGVVDQMASQEPPRSPSGRRMAMRWGLPALGVGAGLYALAAMNRRPEEVAVV